MILGQRSLRGFKLADDGGFSESKSPGPQTVDPKTRFSGCKSPRSQNVDPKTWIFKHFVNSLFKIFL